MIPSGLGARRGQTYQGEEHDTYKLQGQLKEPTVCPTCGAVFHEGRWTWDAKPAGAHETLCPHAIGSAINTQGPCHDQRDLQGYPTRAAHRRRQQHLTDGEKGTSLSRIMAVESQPEGLVISTTDIHVPRRVGEALNHAYRGELELHYDQDEQFVRLTWTR